MLRHLLPPGGSLFVGQLPLPRGTFNFSEDIDSRRCPDDEFPLPVVGADRLPPDDREPLAGKKGSHAQFANGGASLARAAAKLIQIMVKLPLRLGEAQNLFDLVRPNLI